MTNTMIANLEYSELQQLDTDVRRELKKREQEKVVEARKQILAIAESVGMDVEDLVGKNSWDKQSLKKVAAKYRNPSDPQQEWTGRGRKPKWIERLLAEGGKTLAEMGI
jgi:DNA-binding protein H-NS